MSVHQLPRKASLALAGALALGLACPSFADTLDFSAFTSSRIEVRILDAAGNAIQPGSLKVYNGAGDMIDASLPNQDGSYVLGKQSRGKLKFIFSDSEATKGLDGFSPATSFGESGSYLIALLGPKADFYAALMGVTPRVTLKVGEQEFMPDFPIDWDVVSGGSTRSADTATSSPGLRRLPGGIDPTDPNPTPMAPGGFTCATAVPMTLGVTQSDVVPAGWPSFDPCGAFVPGAGKYWTFTPASATLVSMRTNGPGAASFALDTTISVFTGSCAAPQCVAYNDDANGNFTSRVDFCALAGTQYWVEVTNWFGGGAGQTFDLISTTAPPPPLGGGETCAAAVPLVSGVPIQGTTLCGGDTSGLPICELPYGPGSDGPIGAWFSYHASQSGKVKVSTSDPTRFFDSQLRVYCASCPVTTCVASDDDSGPTALFSSELTFNATEDADYIIVLSGFFGSRGDFRITLTELAGSDPYSQYIVHPNDVDTLLQNQGDGQQFGVACGAVGATCIRCLDEANCFENMDRKLAEKIGATYHGDGTKCIELQGPPVLSFNRAPGLPIDPGFVPTDVTDFMNVPAAGNIGHLSVRLDITHTWIGDLDIDLTHLDTGTTTPLFRQSGCANDNVLVTFDDDFPDIFFCVDASNDGFFGLPTFWNADLIRFEGETSLGTWSVRVRDPGFGDGGTFRTWRLNFDNRVRVPVCGPANNGLGNGVDAQPGHSDNCNDCPK